MLDKITQEELDLMNCLCYPISAVECIFGETENLTHSWEEDNFGHIRFAQIPMLSFEYLLDEDPELSPKENFKLSEGMGTIDAFGGRNFGKTHIVEIVDILLACIWLDNIESGFSSCDAIHIRAILEDKLIPVLTKHPFYIMMNPKITRSPNYRLVFPNGFSLISLNMNVASRSPGCFDDKTEILTDKGWKFFKDVSNNEKVLTVNLETNKGEYKKISKKIEEDYNGQVYKLRNKYTEFLVTPNHKFPVLDTSKNITLTEVKDFYHKQIYIPSTFEWEGKKPKEFIEFKGISNSKNVYFKIPFKSWVKFLAWYLSEGCLTKSKDSHYRITIGQKNNNSILERDLNDLDLNYGKRYSKCDDIFVYTISNKLIYQHLEENFGRYKEKRIAPYIKDLPKEYLELFLEIYLLGDGHTRIKDGKSIERVVFSSVKQLADDLQEVALKAGYRANLRKSEQECNGKYFPIYFINLGVTKNSVFKKSEIKTETYSGKVYCVEVEPYNTIYVRRNGKVLISGNSQFFGKHLKRLYIEEASKETNEVFNKRIESKSEIGCVIRSAGMTDFTRYMPAGQRFYELKNKAWICSLPQFCNPNYDEKEKEKAIKKYGGESSIGFRVFVKAEVVEEGLNVFDMQRIRANYLEEKVIKNFEITKNNFHNFENILILDKPEAVKEVYVCADIGESAATEIIILYNLGERFKYIYNITCYGLTDQQQAKIFNFIASKIEVNYVGIDTSDGTGRAIYRSLENSFGQEHMCWVSFQEKLRIDFDRDEKGNLKIDSDGKPVYKEEFVSEWSVKRLKDLFYQGKIILPLDHKLDGQLNRVVSTMSGNRIVYSVMEDEDHLFAAFRVFSISHWMNEFKKITPVMTKKFSKSGV